MPAQLSSRGQAAAKAGEQMNGLDILRNLWDPDTNPAGYVSLGIAENVREKHRDAFNIRLNQMFTVPYAQRAN